MFKKTLAALALAVMAVFAVPAAATAYGPEADGTVVGPVTAGSPVTIVFEEGSFAGSENVSFTVSGFGNVTIAAFKSATDTVVKQAVNGGVSAVVTLPEDARGTYEVTATGLESGIIGTATLTVAAADAGSDANGNGLPNTGAEVPVLALWTAGGALALGAALIAVMTIVRRQRLSQD
jgi:hypothetical protein